MSKRTLVLAILLLGQPLAAEDEPKLLSGTSIVGNDETPKSLYIVPWKSSELGVEVSLTSHLMNDGAVPVDKDVFVRQLEFFEVGYRD